MTSAADLSNTDLLNIAAEVGLFKIIGETRKRVVKIDYVPPRAAMILPRESVHDDCTLNVYPVEPIEITFVLEDAMFGGVVYAALTCNGRVLIHPFVWESHDKLAATAIPVKR